MSRTLILSGLLAAAVAAGGCTWRLTPPQEETAMGRMERADRARADEARMHPACRDSRTDRDDQNDGCRDVVRRDR